MNGITTILFKARRAFGVIATLKAWFSRAKELWKGGWLCVGLALAVLFLPGCATTRIEVPAQWLAPEAPAGTPPAVYSSSKNVSIEIHPDGTVKILGDAATVNSANAAGMVAILDASGKVLQTIPLPTKY